MPRDDRSPAYTRLASAFFLVLGLLVGAAAAVGIVVGFEPSRLPAALLDLAAYKLTFLAAFGLIAAGAVLARHARRADARTGGPPPGRPTTTGVHATPGTLPRIAPPADLPTGAPYDAPTTAPIVVERR